VDGWLAFARRRRSLPAFGAQTKGAAHGRQRLPTSSTRAGDRQHVRFALRGPTGSKRPRSTACLPALALVLLFSSLASPLAVDAQTEKLYRIGMLERTSTAINAANLDGLRRGLRELGYVEGKNFVIEYRSADGRDEWFPGLATDLVRLNVDLILTRGTPATLAAKNATGTIPVIIIGIGDPVAQGIFNMGNPAIPPQWKEVEASARSLGLQAQLLDVRKREDLGPAFEAALRQRADGLVVGLDTITQANRQHIVELAATYRLPAIYATSEFVGGLAAYGVSYPDTYRHAASFIDRIFKGAKPADLPMEQLTKFELVIKLKTAKALGLTIPPSLLLQADQVIQ
jgi:putative ABC transport system substrate-binding protein